MASSSAPLQDQRRQVARDGTRLLYRDFGGSGPPILFLHGLAGYAGEWRSSARLLIDEYRVFALDQRGHGDSERRPQDLSRSAFVADCATVITHIGLGPVTLIGQSMGASTAMLTAAGHPRLVRSLVVIEGSPDGPDVVDPDPAIATQPANRCRHGRSRLLTSRPHTSSSAERTLIRSLRPAGSSAAQAACGRSSRSTRSSPAWPTWVLATTGRNGSTSPARPSSF